MLAVVEAVLREYGLWEEHRGGMLDLRRAGDAYIERGGEFLTVVSGGKVVGCGGLMPRRPGLASVQRMYLLPAARGKGFGRRVLARLLSRARAAGMRRLILETSPRFQDAIRLYLRAGFTPCVLDSDNCCNIVMFRDLPRAGTGRKARR